MSTILLKIKKQIVQLLQNKNLVLYVFFVGVAFVFWFLHSLGKEYVTNIDVKVVYYNFPIDKEPKESALRKLTINVKGYGFSLVRMQLKSAFYDYKIDLSKLKQNELAQENHIRYDLSISAIRNQFEAQLGSGILLNSVFPEEVDFEVRTMKVKKVPVISGLQINPKTGYMVVDKPEIMPDSIVVRGSAETVDTLTAIYTEVISMDKVDKSFEKKVALRAGNTDVELLSKYATLNYEIAEYIDEERVVQVHPLNFPDSAIVSLQPDKVTLKYRTHAKMRKKSTEDDFLLVVDYNTLTNFSRKLEVQPISLPKGISEVHMNPRYLNYMITYKK